MLYRNGGIVRAGWKKLASDRKVYHALCANITVHIRQNTTIYITKTGPITMPGLKIIAVFLSNWSQLTEPLLIYDAFHTSL